MILVLLGTQNNSFVRVIKELEKLIIENKINEEVIIQSGYTKYETTKIKLIDFMPSQELESLIEKADYVVTHGGVGSIILSLKKNKKVIAIPRAKKYSEHVNDHQIEIVDLFNDKGYIIGIHEIEELEEALKNIKEFKPQKYDMNNSKMLNIIEKFIG